VSGRELLLNRPALVVELARDLAAEPRGLAHHFIQLVEELRQSLRRERLSIRHLKKRR
jgi:hypothetical protein